jgi:uncharacterized protein
MAQCLTWFEIPVENIERAKNFYGCLLDVHFEQYKENYFFFSGLDGTTRGALYKRKQALPMGEYPLLCFSCDDCDEVLAQTLRLGGNQVLPKITISPELGSYCQINDTEGNTIAFCSKV